MNEEGQIEVVLPDERYIGIYESKCPYLEEYGDGDGDGDKDKGSKYDNNHELKKSDVKELSGEEIINRLAQHKTHKKKIEEYSEKDANKDLADIYKDTLAVKSMLKIYRYIYHNSLISESKPIWYKGNQDVRNDIMDTKVQLSDNATDPSKISNDLKSLIEWETKQKIYFQSQITLIPIFLDLAYLSFIRKYHKDAKITKFPTLKKFLLIVKLFKIPEDSIYDAFLSLYKDPILIEMSKDIPPFHLRTNMTEEEIKHYMSTTLKDQLHNILEIYLKNNYP